MSLMQTGAVILAESDQNFVEELVVVLEPFEKFLQIPIGFRRLEPRRQRNGLRAGTRGQAFTVRVWRCFGGCFSKPAVHGRLQGLT